MQFLVSSLIRGEKYGYLTLVEQQEAFGRLSVVRRVRISSEDPRAVHGGPHGIVQHQGRFYIGSYSELLTLDQELHLIARKPIPHLIGAHGMCLHQGQIMLSSCNNERVIGVDLEGNVTFDHSLLTDSTLREYYSLPLQEAGEPTHEKLDYAKQPFHVNALQSSGGDLLLCLHKQGALWNLTQNRPVAEDLGERIHDACLFGNKVYVNDTGGNRLMMKKLSDATSMEAVVRFPLPLVTNVHRILNRIRRQLKQNVSTAYPFWLRGLCLTGNQILVGSSPASLHVYDHASFQHRETLFLSKDLREAVFDIVEL